MFVYTLLLCCLVYQQQHLYRVLNSFSQSVYTHDRDSEYNYHFLFISSSLSLNIFSVCAAVWMLNNICLASFVLVACHCSMLFSVCTQFRSS